MPSAASMVAPFLAVALASEPPSWLSLVSDEPLFLAAGTAVEPPSCVFVTMAKGAMVRCFQPSHVRLWVQKKGFEPRLVEAETRGQEVPLGADGWVPQAVRLHLSPRERATDAVVAWVEGGRLVVETTTQGQATGPRVGSDPVRVVVAGPRTAPASLMLTEQERGKEVELFLKSGSSAVIACLDPWQDALLPRCAITLGRVLDVFRERGLGECWSLTPKSKLDASEGFGTVEVPDSKADDELWLQARSEGMGVHLSPFPVGSAFVPIRFAYPAALSVALESEEGKPIPGNISICREVHNSLVELDERETAATGRVSLTLQPGEYRVVGRSAGAAPASETVRVPSPMKELRLALAARPQLRGWVQDGQGAPLPEAVILAVTEGLAFESRQNTAQTDETGGFSLTLPASGPWIVKAEKPGYGAATARVDDVRQPLTLVLFPVCPVRLRLFTASGEPVSEEAVSALRFSTLEAQVARRDAQGTYGFSLSPGEWLVIAEKTKGQGLLSIPQNCASLPPELSLVLVPAKVPIRPNN